MCGVCFICGESAHQGRSLQPLLLRVNKNSRGDATKHRYTPEVWCLYHIGQRHESLQRPQARWARPAFWLFLRNVALLPGRDKGRRERQRWCAMRRTPCRSPFVDLSIFVEATMVAAAYCAPKPRITRIGYRSSETSLGGGRDRRRGMPTCSFANQESQPTLGGFSLDSHRHSELTKTQHFSTPTFRHFTPTQL